MRVADCMTSNVRTIRPQDTLKTAAKIMLEGDIGALPVTNGERLVGMLTDRDIAVRAVAQGLGPNAQVQDAMTDEVLYCFGDQDVDQVAENMSDIQVRRLPVVDRNKRLIGIISCGDLALRTGAETCALAMSGVAAPGGQHSQSFMQS
jgi:CBS domain-containing protein